MAIGQILGGLGAILGAKEGKKGAKQLAGELAAQRARLDRLGIGDENTRALGQLLSSRAQEDPQIAAQMDLEFLRQQQQPFYDQLFQSAGARHVGRFAAGGGASGGAGATRQLLQRSLDKVSTDDSLAAMQALMNARQNQQAVASGLYGQQIGMVNQQGQLGLQAADQLAQAGMQAPVGLSSIGRVVRQAGDRRWLNNLARMEIKKSPRPSTTDLINQSRARQGSLRMG